MTLARAECDVARMLRSTACWPISALGAGRTSVALALVFALAGCAYDAEDLDRWRNTAKGPEHLAGYLLDSHRPLNLRQHAASHLFAKDALEHLMSAVDKLEGVEQQAMLKFLVDFVAGVFESSEDDQVLARAASLAYYLMEYADQLDKGYDKRLIEPTLRWALDAFDQEGGPAARVKPRAMILGALTIRPEIAAPPVLEAMRELYKKAAADYAERAAALKEGRQKDAQNLGVSFGQGLLKLLRLSALVGELRHAETHRATALVLLQAARDLYPNVPEGLAEAMVANQDETGLRFLLDAVRDHRVPDGTRDVGLRAARELLRAKSLDQLLRLVATDDPSVNNVPRMSALEMAWDFGGVERLEEALRKLPPDGTWPRDGADFKDEVDLFCDNRVARSREAALPVLTRLTTNTNWVARIYAIECIIRLFPQRAPELLAGLEVDSAPLHGWSVDGPTTIGDVVKQVTSAAR